MSIAERLKKETDKLAKIDQVAFEKNNNRDMIKSFGNCLKVFLDNGFHIEKLLINEKEK